MPLNHVSGERVDGMDAVWRVVPLAKYQQQTRLTTVIEVPSSTKNGRFKRLVRREYPIWEAALNYAIAAYKARGANPGMLAYDCIAQEYPRTGCICFIFNAEIGGVEYYVQAPFKLSDEQIADLAVRNLWLPYRLHS